MVKVCEKLLLYYLKGKPKVLREKRSYVDPDIALNIVTAAGLLASTVF